MLRLLYSIDIDGRRGRIIRWEERPIRVYDDAMTALRIIALFGDEDVSPYAKQYIVMRLLFPDPEAVQEAIEDIGGLLSNAIWDVAGVDIDGSHDGEYGESIIDWEQDADVIEASLWQAYSAPLSDIAHKVSFHEFGKLVGMAPHETPIGQAIYYRTADEPKSTKYNQEDVARFRKLRQAWSLKNKASVRDAGAAANNQATSMFSSLKRVAHG
ncbi:MAG: Gp15 family bacteriophage protein [Gordonibacter sp.]|uniref:Gp15 family bacteriophage protein n=1 Tax=Gordonibacter sp. TaxID=1968902 RepID=UPI002FCB293F